MHNRDIAHPQALARTVGDRTHGLPHRHVLIRDAGNSRMAARLHGLTILQIVVVRGADAAELRIQVDADARPAERAPGFLLDPLAVAPGDEIEHGVRVVDGNVEDRQVVAVVGRNQHRERRDEQRNAQVIVRVRVFDGMPYCDVAKSERCAFDVEPWRLVGRRAQPFLRRGAGTLDRGGGRSRRLLFGGDHVRCMQRRAVRRIDRPFQYLRPIAIDANLDDAGANRGRGCPCGGLEFARRGRIAHPDPDETARLAARIAPVFQTLLGAAAGRLRWAVHDGARDIDLPAVIQASEPAFLVAAEGERRAAVRTMQVEHAQAAGAVAERHEFLAQHANGQGSAIGLRDFLREARRDPVRAHEPSHRRVALDPREQVVVFAR